MRHGLRLLGAVAVMSAGTGNVCRADAPDAPGVLATPPSATRIAEKMESVADVLHQKHTGDPVQGQQKTIVRDLDALIASLEKQCEACKNGIKRNNPRNGMLDSMISRGTGGIGTLVNANDAGKDWAKLSDRERDRILQSMSEGFPPEYRTVLERYYRRLAEEKAAPAPGAAAKPAEAEATTGAPEATPEP